MEVPCSGVGGACVVPWACHHTQGTEPAEVETYHHDHCTQILDPGTSCRDDSNHGGCKNHQGTCCWGIMSQRVVGCGGPWWEAAMEELVGGAVEVMMWLVTSSWTWDLGGVDGGGWTGDEGEVGVVAGGAVSPHHGVVRVGARALA